MKGSGSVVAASMAVATAATAVASYSDPMPDYVSNPQSHERKVGKRGDDVDDQQRGRSDPTGRFAPRFDGLRFIETLVTAHR